MWAGIPVVSVVWPVLAGLVAVLPLLGCAENQNSPAVSHNNALSRHIPPMSGGIQVNEPNLDEWVNAVRAAGLDSVQVTLYARQLAWSSSEMNSGPSSNKSG